MDLFIIYKILLFAVLTVTSIVMATNAIAGPFLRRAGKPVGNDLVAILIPARNEEHNIDACIQSFLQQDYQNIEILVLDDESLDRTAEIVLKYEMLSPKVKLLRGTPLPSGWLGKNWACHQLSKQANGDYLLFADADVRAMPTAVSKTIATMEKNSVGLFSAFPQQITKTPIEKLVVPIIEFIFFGYLPLWLTLKTPSKSLAANGQWIAFTREAYRTFGGHASVKHQIVEDIEISRVAKMFGVRTLLAAGTDELQCRMYRSADEVFKGFSKNAFAAANFKISLIFVLWAFLFSTYLLPFILIAIPAFSQFGILASSILVVQRVFVSLALKQNFLPAIFGLPLSIVLAIWISFNSMKWFKTGRAQWKSRKIGIAS